VQRDAQIVKDLDGGRPQGGCPPQIGYSLFRSSGTLAEGAEVVERADQIRFEVERPLVAFRCLVLAAGFFEYIAEVMMKTRDFRRGPQSLAECGRRPLRFALVMRQQSEHMESVGAIVIAEQDLMVPPVGTREVSRAMAAERGAEIPETLSNPAKPERLRIDKAAQP